MNQMGLSTTNINHPRLGVDALKNMQFDLTPEEQSRRSYDDNLDDDLRDKEVMRFNLKKIE